MSKYKTPNFSVGKLFINKSKKDGKIYLRGHINGVDVVAFYHLDESKGIESYNVIKDENAGAPKKPASPSSNYQKRSYSKPADADSAPF